MAQISAAERLIDAHESRTMKRLTPRAYQSELFALAEKQNVIVRGDTGTGKTFVAAMVIKALLSTPKAADEPHKLVCFFAPKVALASQQYRVLQTQLPGACIKLYYGDMDEIDNWQTDKWKRELEEADVIVSTPQVFLDVLRHGFWSLRRVSLLVFDEAHHATKRNPYNLIMAEHYFDITNPSERPRVMGMTASPVYESRRAIQAIGNLESNLDARLVEVQENRDELAAVSHRPKEIVSYYEGYHGYLRQSPVEEFFRASTALDAIHDDTEKETFTRQLLNIKAAMGPLGGDYFLLDWLKLVIKRARPSTPDAQGYLLEPAFIHELEDIVRHLEPMVINQKPTPETVSPKVLRVIYILEQFQSPNFVAVVFVQQRTHCAALLRMLQTCESLAHFIKPVSLMGHGGKAGAQGGMPVALQTRVVEQLRRGEANVLVATQVAEEGMDFPACSLCIRFDLPQTLVSFIQSRGRARAVNATFISLCLEGSNEAENASSWQQQEDEQRKHLQNRDLEEEIDEPELEDTPKYTLPETGAQLTHAAAISLLNMVCSLLPHEKYELRPKPEFNIYPVGRSFVADVLLPIMPKLPDDERRISGAPSPSKMGARRAAAFKACCQLNMKGILNAHLLPERPGQAEVNRYADDSEVDRTPIAAEHAVEVVNIFGPPDSDLYFHRLRFISADGQQDGVIGLIAGAAVPDPGPVQLYADPDIETSLVMTLDATPQKLSWDETERGERIEILRAFNKYIIVAALNRHFASATKLVHLVAPLKADHSIDWDLLANYSRPMRKDEAEPGMLAITTTGALSNSRLNIVERFYPEITADSIIGPLATSDGLQPENRSVATHFGTYKLYWQGAYHTPVEDLTPDQPILLLSSPRPARNMLVPWPSETRENAYVARRRVLPLCVLHKSHLPMSFWHIITAMPSWLRAWTDKLRIDGVRQALKLPVEIPDKMLLHALTLPQATIGYDYETLETIGDTQLKLCTTVHLVLNFPDKLEGALTHMKHNSTDNLFLRKQALKLGLGAFMMSERFQTSNWVPPSTLNGKLSADGLTVERWLKRRVFSDCCESLMGAAWMSYSRKHGTASGIQAVLQVGESLGLHFGGTKPWSERMPAQGKPMACPRTLSAIERQIHYTFHDARWLLRAVTHRTRAEKHGAYEVIEYLGDAVVDAWIVQHITERFPGVTNESLSRFKGLLASNGCMGYISIRHLELPQHLLHSAPLLNAAMAQAAEEIAAVPPAELLPEVPFLEPPKVAADMVEALVGAVFLDCCCNLDTTFAVCARIFAEITPLLTKEGPPLDPISALRQAGDKMGCRAITNTIDPRIMGSTYWATCRQHGQVLGRGEHSRVAAAAKQRSAANALPNLSKELCDCPPIELRKPGDGLNGMADDEMEVDGANDYTFSDDEKVVEYDPAYDTSDDEDEAYTSDGTLESV